MYTVYVVVNGEEDGGVVVYVSVAVEGVERLSRRMQLACVVFSTSHKHGQELSLIHI